MIQLARNIWIGDSTDERSANLSPFGIDAILNVAHDLQATRGWTHKIEYMQVGLIDGPGNPLAAYHAAVLALAALIEHRRVLICCHTGGRSLAVALMYLHLSNACSWEEWLTILYERIEEGVLPVVHRAHREAFDRINWRYLANIVENV